MGDFRKYTSIESFAHVYRGQDYFDEKAAIHYGTKIKLHGTNAAVRVTLDNEVYAQSRSRDITPDSDNAGFANWVSITHDVWAFPPQPKWLMDLGYRGDVIYYGEWAGKGIQKGDAVCQLEDKYFFVYAVYDEQSDTMIVDPDMIEQIIPDLDQIVVLPWDVCWTVPLDFNNAEACENFGKMLTHYAEEVGEQDPFIYGIFGIEGPGEGIVVTPMCNPGDDPSKVGTVDAYWYNRMIFKVKAERHAVKQGQSGKKDIVVPEGVPEFVETFVTPARCEQGLSEVGGVALPEKTGDFMKWLGQDVKKESELELSDMGLEWKDVSKHVGLAARTWWLKKCEEI